MHGYMAWSWKGIQTMSELAHRRFMRAERMADVDPKDALEAVLWEMRNPEPGVEPVQHVMILRASIAEGGLEYQITQAGKFNIAERIGLLNVVTTRIAGPD